MAILLPQPLRGWSTWSYFTTEINESLVLDVAAGLHRTGLAAAGFNHLHIDAGLLLPERDAAGGLQANLTRFPSGVANLSRALRDRWNLSLGLYTDLGNTSCGPGPGSYGHYADDASRLLVEWGARAVKVDFCDFWFMGEPPRYEQQLGLWRSLRDALNATGVPAWLYFSPHTRVPASGVSAPWAAAHPYAPPPAWTREERRGLANSMMTQYVNMFDYWFARHWKDDFLPGRCRRRGPSSPPLDPQCGKSPPGGFLTNVDAMVALAPAAASGPGYWADAQQLLVCNFGGAGDRYPGGGMTLEEYRAQYSIWALLA
eukprot:g4522.t1